MSTVDAGPVRELRLVVTAPDYDEAVRFYRDVLGLPERESYSSPTGGDDPRAVAPHPDRRSAQAEFIDRVGRPARGQPHRVALEVVDPARRWPLEEASATVLAPPTYAVAVDERPARGTGRAAAHVRRTSARMTASERRTHS